MFPITKTTLNSVIAKQLNILESAIAEVQEWAKVLWVRFKSGRPRFVSKKVIEVKKMSNNFFDNFEPDNSKSERAEEMAAELNQSLPVGNCVEYSKLFSYACDILENRISFNDAIAKLSSKKVIILKK